MEARFVGEIGGALPRSSESQLTTRRFEGGFVAHGRGVATAERDGVICILRGAPRLTSGSAASRVGAAEWLAEYERRGVDVLAATRGRFCVAVIDTRAQSVVIATDRFATWPVCYRATADSFRFADRADVVAGDAASIAPQAIFDYLYFHMIPGPSTVFDGVLRLRAGTVASWSRGNLKVEPYWRPRFVEQRRSNLEECRAKFLQLVKEAVAAEMDGSRLGAFLSGGTDSSTVAGMLQRCAGTAKTYSMGFAEAGYDEMEYARIAARHFGTEHHEYYVTPGDLLEKIPRVAAHYDQPFGNSSAAPALVCAEQARADGVDKMLAGDGGDELFGGNTRYAKQRVFGWYDDLPAPLRSSVIEPLLLPEWARRVPLVKKASSYVRQARVPMPQRMQTYNLLTRIGFDVIFEPRFLQALDAAAPERLQVETWRESAGASLLNRMLAFDWKYTLTDNDLPKVVETTGLAGVEVAFPLLSDDLVEFSMSLPTDWKLKGLKLRWFFKDALKEFLPQEILTKQKHGFGLPFGAWACRQPELASLARETVEATRRRGLVRADFVDRLMNEYLPAYPGYYGELVWTLMVLELWLQRHAPNWRV